MSFRKWLLARFIDSEVWDSTPAEEKNRLYRLFTKEEIEYRRMIRDSWK